MNKQEIRFIADFVEQKLRELGLNFWVASHIERELIDVFLKQKEIK